MVDRQENDWQKGDPEATVLAPWSKRRQENEAFIPTEVSQAPELPLPAVQVQGSAAGPRQRKFGRRQLLIGGIATATVAAAGGVTLATIFTRTNLLQLVKPTPTPMPGPRTFIAGKAVMNISGHSDTVNVVAWDPSGRYLASAGQDTRVMLWDLGQVLQKPPTSLQTLNQPLYRWKFAQAILATDMMWSPDGRSLAVAAGDMGKFYVVDAATGNPTPQSILNSKAINISPLDPEQPPVYNSLAWNPRTNIIAAFEQDFPQVVQVDYWQVDKPTNPLGSYTYNDPTQSQNDPLGLGVINWSPDGSLLAGFMTNLSVVVWNAQKRNVRTVIALPDRLNGQSPFIYRFALVWSPVDPNVFAVADIDVIAVCDVRKSQPLYLLKTSDVEAYTPPQNEDGLSWAPQVHGITWSPNGRYIAASYSRSARVSVWDLKASNPQMQDGMRVQQVLFPQGNEPGHTGTVYDLAWSPDGRYLATGSTDKTIIIWQVDEF